MIKGFSTVLSSRGGEKMSQFFSTYSILLQYPSFFSSTRLQVYQKELEEVRGRDNFIMKEIRVDTMKRNVELLDRLTSQFHQAKEELQVN